MPGRARRTVYSILIAISLLATAATPLADDRTPAGCPTDSVAAASSSWPGWRGATAQGKAPGPLPIHWSAEHHIRWKTPIPGRAHSSPVVSGDRVYVTTADVTTGGVVLDSVCRLLALALALLVGSLALRVVAGLFSPECAPDAGALATATLILASVLMLIVAVCSGDELFGVARSPVRAWIVSVIFASLCLTLAALSVDRRALRSLIGLSAMALAVFVLAAFPSQPYVFYRGVPSLRLEIALATAAAPLLVGCASLLAACSWNHSRRTRRILIAGFGLAVSAGAAVFLRHLLGFRDDGFPEIQYASRISAWLLLMPAAWTGAWFCRRLLRASLSAQLAFAAAGAISLVVTVAIAIEFLATQSPYFAYQLGTPRVTPLGGAMLSAAGTVAVFGAMRPGGGDRERRIRSLASTPALGLVAVALGALFFLRVNFVHRHEAMTR